MTPNRPRVLILSEIPTPYRLPFYRRLASTEALSMELAFLAESEPDRPWRLDVEATGVPYRVLSGYSPRIRTRRNSFVYEVNPGVLRLLRSERWDALVIGGYAVFAEQVAIAYGRAVGIPYLLHSESHLAKQRSAGLRTIKDHCLPTIVRGASAGLAVGSAAARYLEAYGLAPGRIRIVPNTIDVDDYRRRAADAVRNEGAIRSRLGVPDRFLLYAGRLVEAKGLLDLRDAVERLGDDAPTILVAGEGPLEPDLSELDAFRLIGFQERETLIELYALADAFVLPSRDEPWGVVVNEALACGTSVITTDAVGAAEDLVIDGVNGRVIPVGDSEALAAALRGPYPRAEGGRIARWTYEFAVDQFLEALTLALS